MNKKKKQKENEKIIKRKKRKNNNAHTPRPPRSPHARAAFGDSQPNCRQSDI
jgi:hypothetical protein